MREVDLQDRNPPVILHLWIELDEVVLAGKHLAARDPDARLRDIAAPDLPLPRGAVSGKVRGELREFRLAAGGIHHVAADEVLPRRLHVDVLERGNRNAGQLSVV